MTDFVDFDALKQYEDIFGPEKMKQLWREYFDDARQKLQKPEEKSSDEIRLIYHSLRSSSLVFGMARFAEICEKIEEYVLEKRDINEILPLIKEADIRFAEAVKKIAPHFA